MLKSENKKGVCVHRWREPIVPSHSHFLCSVDKVEWSAFCVLQYPMKKSLNTMFCCTLSRLLSRHYFGTNWMLSVPFHFTRWPELLCVSERIASSILLAGAPLLLLKLSLVPIFGTVDNCPSGKQQGGDLKIAIMTFYFFSFNVTMPWKGTLCFKFQIFYLQRWKISIIKLTTITIMTTITVSLKMILLALSLSVLSTVSATTTTMSGVAML